MATTMKQLESQLLELKQLIVGYSAVSDKRWTEYLSDRELILSKIGVYHMIQREGEQAPAPAPSAQASRGEPWRLPIDQFKNWAAGIEQNWEPNGNARVGQRLAKALQRTSGHAEGQLYINWCEKVGRAAVKAFWISRGHPQVPEGL